MVLNSHVPGLQKSKGELKTKDQGVRHLKVDPVLKIDATFHNSLDLCVHNI